MAASPREREPPVDEGEGLTWRSRTLRPLVWACSDEESDSGDRRGVRCLLRRAVMVGIGPQWARHWWGMTAWNFYVQRSCPGRGSKQTKGEKHGGAIGAPRRIPHLIVRIPDLESEIAWACVPLLSP